jgi:heme exporter protein B
MGLLFSTLMLGVSIAAPGDFIVAILLVSLGLAATLTIIAAIIARTASKGALYPVLSFPMILPLLMLGVPLLEDAFAGRSDASQGSVLLLLLYTATLIVVSYTLFDLLWKE